MKKILSVLLFCFFLVPTAAASSPSAPVGYELDSSRTIFPGVDHISLVRTGPDQVVNAAVIAPDTPVELRPVLSNERIAGSEPRSERTSSMCQRVGCLVAINGDFFDVQQAWSLGGLVTNGEMKKSPNSSHHQLKIGKNGSLSSGQFEWKGTLLTTDLQDISLNGVNVPREADSAILYTSSWGETTQTNQYGHELILHIVEPEGPVRLDQTSRVKLVAFREAEGDSPIPNNGVVISGHGQAAQRLASLWSAVINHEASPYALLRLESPSDVKSSIGGTPILVKDGKRWFADAETTFVKGRHPRTAVGWNGDGRVWLVTVDGRQAGYSAGMTLAELADLMISLGATEAMNLDGGGSTTFVVESKVLNRPSDRMVRKNGSNEIAHIPGRFDRLIGNIERPVTDALTVVPLSQQVRSTSDPLASDFGLPALEVPALSALDPASNPISAMPALLPRSNSSNQLVALALAINMAVAAALATKRVIDYGTRRTRF